MQKRYLIIFFISILTKTYSLDLGVEFSTSPIIRRVTNVKENVFVNDSNIKDQDKKYFETSLFKRGSVYLKIGKIFDRVGINILGGVNYNKYIETYENYSSGILTPALLGDLEVAYNSNKRKKIFFRGGVIFSLSKDFSIPKDRPDYVVQKNILEGFLFSIGHSSGRDAFNLFLLGSMFVSTLDKLQDNYDREEEDDKFRAQEKNIWYYSLAIEMGIRFKI